MPSLVEIGTIVASHSWNKIQGRGADISELWLAPEKMLVNNDDEHILITRTRDPQALQETLIK